MVKNNQFLSELVCKGCGRAGRITWEGIGEAKRAVEISDNIKEYPGNPPTYTCCYCWTTYQSV